MYKWSSTFLNCRRASIDTTRGQIIHCTTALPWSGGQELGDLSDGTQALAELRNSLEHPVLARDTVRRQSILCHRSRTTNQYVWERSEERTSATVHNPDKSCGQSHTMNTRKG